MEIDEAILAYLSGYAGLTALQSDRLYLTEAPQNPTYPLTIIEFISEETTDTFIQPTSELTADTFQFSVWATTRKAADSVARQIKKAFKNYSGVMGGAGGVTVDAVMQVNKLKDFDEATKIYRTLYEFQIWYQEV
jgi:hypothetical protein